MPILPLEPFVFPEHLFENLEAVGQGEERWWVLHTRPRAEKALARGLLKRNQPFFLPLYKRQWRSHGRLFNAHLPLFPGYIFLHGDSHARLLALETNQVARVIHVENQGQLQKDLIQIQRLMNSGVSLVPEDCLQPGMQVEIISGPLAGMEGRILRRNNSSRFFVEVHFLQQGVSVDIEGWMIKPLNKECEMSVGAGV
jgi:transcriptional antiterminator RfaH